MPPTPGDFPCRFGSVHWVMYCAPARDGAASVGGATRPTQSFNVRDQVLDAGQVLTAAAAPMFPALTCVQSALQFTVSAALNPTGGCGAPWRMCPPPELETPGVAKSAQKPALPLDWVTTLCPTYTSPLTVSSW